MALFFSGGFSLAKHWETSTLSSANVKLKAES
jgi:hypothetical protein